MGLQTCLQAWPTQVYFCMQSRAVSQVGLSPPPVENSHTVWLASGGVGCARLGETM
jgi:hypothetical protein